MALTGAEVALINKVLDFAIAAMEFVPESMQRQKAHVQAVRAMYAEGRNPTDEEIEPLNVESDEITQELRDILAAKRAEESAREGENE